MSKTVGGYTEEEAAAILRPMGVSRRIEAGVRFGTDVQRYILSCQFAATLIDTFFM